MTKTNGLIGFLIFFSFIYYLLYPLVSSKLKLIKNQQIREAFKITNDLANLIVPELAVMSNLSNAERKKEAIDFVTRKLADRGVNLSPTIISATVEMAYQMYKNVIKGDCH